MPADIAEKIIAAIAAKEAKAQAATRGAWRIKGLYRQLEGCRCLSCYEDTPWAYEIDVVDGPDSGNCFYPMHIDKPDAEFIADNGPDEVLRSCAADRETLERHRPVLYHGRFSEDERDCDDMCDHDGQPMVCRTCRDYAGDPEDAPCPDLLTRARAYGVGADHA
jgi:hypothetical protein